MSRERIVDVVLGVRETPSRSRPAIAGLVSAVLLGTLGFGVLAVQPAPLSPLSPPVKAARQVVEVLLPRQPSRPPPANPPRTQPERRAAPALAPRPAQQAAAPAAHVVTAASEASVDLTDEVIVVGSGSAWLGGVTRVDGMATVPGVAGDEGPGPPPSDHSRPVGLADPEWGCPWPAEHVGDALEEMTAVVQVTVRSDGTATEAVVLEDPGLGFGEAARRCALSSTFEPALDRGGRPVLARSPPIRVRFWR